MEEIFEDKVLDDLCDVRTNGFESSYIKKYGKPEAIKESEKKEAELMELIEKYVTKENQEYIIQKFSDFKDNMIEEICFWHKPYYKMGFIDGMKLRNEIKEFQNIEVKENNPNSLIHKNVIQYIKEDCFTFWKEREDYKILTCKMNEIKEKYPNVRAFLEDDDIIELNEKELKALKNYMELDKDMKNIEIEEGFKWGLKESLS